MTNRPVLQEMLKRVLQGDKKGHYTHYSCMDKKDINKGKYMGN